MNTVLNYLSNSGGSLRVTPGEVRQVRASLILETESATPLNAVLKNRSKKRNG